MHQLFVVFQRETKQLLPFSFLNLILKKFLEFPRLQLYFLFMMKLPREQLLKPCFNTLMQEFLHLGWCHGSLLWWLNWLWWLKWMWWLQLFMKVVRINFNGGGGCEDLLFLEVFLLLATTACQVDFLFWLVACWTDFLFFPASWQEVLVCAILQNKKQQKTVPQGQHDELTERKKKINMQAATLKIKEIETVNIKI